MGSSATPLRAGVYGRESKGKQKSVDDQVALGTTACNEHGWELAGVYDDGSSASRFATKARKDWHRLDADIKAHKLDVLIVWEITRGSREPVEGFTWLNLCRDNAVLIYVISEDELYDPRKTRHYDTLGRLLLDGAKESNTTSDRVLRGVRAAAAREEGATPHGRTPDGYMRLLRNPELVTRPDKMPWDEFYVQVPEPVRAPLIVEVFQRIARADPIVHIVGDFNRRGIPGSSGGDWNRQTVRKIIRNPAYMGKREYGGELREGVWEGLVSEKLWYQANQVLDAPNRKRDKPGQKKWLLSYIATSKCGGPLHGAPARDGRKAKYHCLADGCTGVGQWELDEFMSRLVCARLSREDARDLFVPDGDEFRQAEEILLGLERRLDGFRKSAAAGETSPSSLAVVERELEPKIEEARRRVVNASAPAALAELVTAEDVRSVWNGLPLAARREVVQTLFESVKVGAAGKPLGRWSTDEDRLEAVAARVEIAWRR